MSESSSSKDVTMSEDVNTTLISKRKVPDNSTMSDSKKLKNTFAFCFQLHPLSELRKAITALSNTEFNPSGTGLLEASDWGFAITTHRTVQDYSGVDPNVFGLLYLPKESLLSYECTAPFKQYFVLNGIASFLDNCPDDHVVYADADFELGELCFDHKAHVDAPVSGFPLCVFMYDVTSSQSTRFPDVEYGLMKRVLTFSDLNRYTYDTMSLDPAIPRTVALIVEAETVKNDSEDEGDGLAEDLEVSFTWPFWNASAIPDSDCFLHLVLGLPTRVMLKFKVGECGDLIFMMGGRFDFDKISSLRGAYFVSVPDTGCANATRHSESATPIMLPD